MAKFSIGICIDPKSPNFLRRDKLVRLYEALFSGQAKCNLYVMSRSGSKQEEYVTFHATAKAVKYSATAFNNIPDSHVLVEGKLPEGLDDPRFYTVSDSLADGFVGRITMGIGKKSDIPCSVPVWTLQSSKYYYTILPFSIQDTERLKNIYVIRTLLLSANLMQTEWPSSLKHLSKMMKHNTLGVSPIIAKWQRPWDRAKYVIIDEPHDESLILDLLKVGIIPILLNVKYSGMCVDGYNAALGGVYDWIRVADSAYKCVRVPKEDRISFVSELQPDFDLNTFIKWLKKL